MNYSAITIFGPSMILIALISVISTHLVFAGGYGKSQVISQANECGNYWFPVNIICSNLNSQTQGQENNVAVATTPEKGSTDSSPDTNYGTPFP